MKNMHPKPADFLPDIPQHRDVDGFAEALPTSELQDQCMEPCDVGLSWGYSCRDNLDGLG